MGIFVLKVFQFRQQSHFSNQYIPEAREINLNGIENCGWTINGDATFGPYLRTVRILAAEG